MLHSNVERKHLNHIFFPWTIAEWNSLDINIRNSSYATFKIHLIHKFRPDILGLKLLTRLRLGLSHLNEFRYDHKFNNFVSPKCIYSSENESTSHFRLHCHFYIPITNTLFYQVKEIVTNLQELSDQNITEILLYGSPRFTDIQNCVILKLSLILLWITNDLLALYFSVELLVFIKNMTKIFSLFISVPKFFSHQLTQILKRSTVRHLLSS